MCRKRRCPDPSAFMIEIPVHRGPLPGGHRISPGLAYAIFEPSGDQAGERPRVSRRCPDPSAFMSQISESSLRSDRNAIRVPSGDHVGSNSGQGDRVSRVRRGGGRSTGSPTNSRWWRGTHRGPVDHSIRRHRLVWPPTPTAWLDSSSGSVWKNRTWPGCRSVARSHSSSTAATPRSRGR